MDRNSFKTALVPFVRRLPAAVREPLRHWWRSRYGEPLAEAEVASLVAFVGPELDVLASVPIGAADPAATLDPQVSPDDTYQQRIAQETAIFTNMVQVHDLPDIYHYWSNKYLLPMEQAFGAKHPEDFLAKYLFESAQRTGSAQPRFVSLGCGNCDAEVRIAQNLIERGLTDFVLECVDINPAMIERGRELARAAGLGEQVIPLQGDFNRWQPVKRYDGIMANQSLHHVQELESLFDAIRDALAPQAWFVVSDMIGRNGHLRWPEARAIVQEYWRELPDGYRHNRQLSRHDPEFLDWDCSTEGFEGVRAQDILPLLIERFGFEVFLPFGNLIDPFIDRGIGHHFVAQRDWDRDFIDRVHARDEAELKAGRITPTHMMAVLRVEPGPGRYRDRLSPEFCLRHAVSGLEWPQFRSLPDYEADSARRASTLQAHAEIECTLTRLAAREPVRFVCTICGGPTDFSLAADETPNWREGLSCGSCRINARMRLSLELMRLAAPRGPQSKVYLTEQATWGYVAARGLFASVTGSEYVLDAERREALSVYLRAIAGDASLSIHHEDATALRFDNASFDAIGSFDVLEHVPDYRRALAEFARVLRRDGVLVLTAPFLSRSQDTLVRARVSADGAIEHLLAPEYHGDPVGGDQGVLCYYHFGWDLLDALREAGFRDARVVKAWSPAAGYLGDLSTIVATR